MLGCNALDVVIAFVVKSLYISHSLSTYRNFKLVYDCMFY